MAAKKKKQKIVNFNKKLDEYLKTIPDGSRNVPKLAPETNVKLRCLSAFVHNSKYKFAFSYNQLVPLNEGSKLVMKNCNILQILLIKRQISEARTNIYF